MNVEETYKKMYELARNLSDQDALLRYGHNFQDTAPSKKFHFIFLDDEKFISNT